MLNDITKHKNILIKILKDIYTDVSIGPVLGFKGGTAAYIFYSLPRFSVDLDFDLIEAEKEDYVFKKIENIAEKYGGIKNKKIKRFTLFFELSYDEKSRNIKIEINRRNFGSKYDTSSYLGIPMLVMTKEDMFAHKITAMMERIGKTNRDIFDVWFFLRNDWPVNKEIVEQRTGMKFKDFLKKCIHSIEKINDRSLLSGIGELIDAKQKSWVKINLKKDIIFLLKLYLDAEK
ncbi:MAG: nucleotidyl transferase AbiEii/AbiGii toxin family protein [Candidatus Gracilibacteria bacterium]|jgi:predicted nucleotidyltransferase component of viral defense system